MAKYTPLSNVTTKTEFAAEFQKIANAINDQLDKTEAGSNQLQVDLDVNGYRLINLPVPTDPTDAVRVVDLPGVFFNFFDASNFNYDNTTSGLSATNVQDAIDEVDNNVDVLDSRIDTVEFTLGNFGPRLVTAENDIDQLQTDVTAVNFALANEIVRIDNLEDDKADKDVDAVVDNLAVFDAVGNPVDGGLSIQDILNTAPTFVQETMPSGTIEEGATWYSPTLATTFIYYVDDDSAQWIEVGFSVDAEAGVAQADFLNLTDRVTDLEDTRGTAATADIQTGPTDATAGRVLTVGAFGLGVVPPVTADLNDLGAGRTGSFNSSTSNRPPGLNDGVVICIARNENRRQQIAADNEVITFRSQVSTNVWSPWREIWHEGNLTHAQNVSGGTVSSNGTTSGSNLNPSQAGTWRNVSAVDISDNGYGMWMLV